MEAKTAIRRRLISLCLVSACSASSILGAEIFVDIPGVPGDSEVSGFVDAIVARQASGNFEKGRCGDFIIEKNLDSASPLLIRDTVRGAIYAEVSVVYRTMFGGASATFLELTLTNARIKRLSLDNEEDDFSAEDEGLIEAVAFAPDSIEIRFTPFDDTGSAGATVVENVVCGKAK